MSKPVLLSGDNPQIARGYGEEPIAAYLAAVPDTGPGGWKHQACRAIDAAISRIVPGVQKAVKWNTPLYGMEKDHFFAGFHCTGNYVKISFMRGAELDPMPPEPSKQAKVRYYHLREGETLGEDFADWVRQASDLPGVKM